MNIKIKQLSRNNQGEPVLLIHGWAMNGYIWQPLVDTMPDYTFYSLDLPGHGENRDLDVGDDLHVWNSVVLDAFQQLSLPYCHIVAWSLGGVLATRMAGSLGEKCHSLTLICSNPKFVASDDWQYAMPAAYLDKFMQNLQQNIHQVVRDFMELQVRGVLHAKSVLDKLMVMVEQGGFASEAGLKNGLSILRSADMRHELCRLTCPLNFILGKNDTLVPAKVKQDLQLLRTDMPVHVLAKSGHAPFVSHIEETTVLLGTFLQSLKDDAAK